MANHLKRDKQVNIVRMLVEGCSIRAIERITNVHRDTIMRLGLRIGQHCERMMVDRLSGLECSELQIDEIWGFVGKKQRRLEPDDPPEYGDAYTFIALDPVTKLVVHHLTGKRNEHYTDRFMYELSWRVEGRVHMCVDGFAPYPSAIREFFQDRADAMAIVKSYRAATDDEHRYSPPSVAACRRFWIQGFPQRSKSTTSHIERLNLTCRMQIRRLTRLTNAFSKRLEGLKAGLSMTLCWYNFVRPHRSLCGATPAMVAGLSRSAWTVEDLVPAN